MAISKILNVNKKSTDFSTLVAEKILQKYLAKKIGATPDVIVNSIQVTEQWADESDSDIYVHLDVEAILPKSALMKLLVGREISCS